MRPLAARLLDDHAFRVLAIPFGGPIPSPHSPRGVDLDGQWFSERTDITVNGALPKVVTLDWHHGKDSRLKRTTIGKAFDLELGEEGWWATVVVDRSSDAVRLIRKLADRGVELFGSSESKSAVVNQSNGHIAVWPYLRQTLSTSPQNTYSVLRPYREGV